MSIKDFFKIASVITLLLINPAWADDDDEDYDESTLQIQTQIKEGEALLKKAKKIRNKSTKTSILKKAAQAFSVAYIQVNNLDDVDDLDIEEQVSQHLQSIHQDVLLKKEIKKIETQTLGYLKKKVLTAAQRQKLISYVSELYSLDSSRREFKQIKDLFIPSKNDEDDDEDNDEDDEDDDDDDDDDDDE
jgi:hypothetical protein